MSCIVFKAGREKMELNVLKKIWSSKTVILLLKTL